MADDDKPKSSMDQAEILNTETACRWAVVIIAAREDVDTLLSTIDAAIAACDEHKAIIDVLINGNKMLADTIARSIGHYSQSGPKSVTLRIWHLAFGDKAHAWNQYVHKIWPGSDIAYFVDGYARAQPDSFSHIANALLQTPDALAATAVPSVGHSGKALAKKMISEGGIHGNLHAIRGAVLGQFRVRDIRLPLRLYRGEATIGSIMAFKLDPAAHKWHSNSCVVQPKATWWFEPSSMWRLRDLIAQFNRRFRQARGTLENRAVRQHLSLNKRAPEQFPETADEMISNWVRDFPDEARKLFFFNPLCFWEARKAKQPQDCSQAQIEPELLAETRPG